MNRPPGTVALARALSKLGLASRSEAMALIRAGRIAVDGRVVFDPGAVIVPERVRIVIDGQARKRAGVLTILLNKPRGIVTTVRDPEGRQTVADLVADAPARVMPVGRLDRATSGLLLLTTDSRFGDWITNPANAMPRTYAVSVRGAFRDEDARALERGLTDDDGPLAAYAVAVRKRSTRETHLLVTLTEGRNREVRRLFAALGYEVTKLSRVSFGGLVLGNLQPGRWRVVEQEELRRAFPGAPIGGGPGRTRPARRPGTTSEPPSR